MIPYFSSFSFGSKLCYFKKKEEGNLTKWLFLFYLKNLQPAQFSKEIKMANHQNPQITPNYKIQIST